MLSMKYDKKPPSVSSIRRAMDSNELRWVSSQPHQEMWALPYVLTNRCVWANEYEKRPKDDGTLLMVDEKPCAAKRFGPTYVSHT